MQTVSVSLTTGQSDSFTTSGAGSLFAVARAFCTNIELRGAQNDEGNSLFSPVSSVVFFFLPSYGSTSATSAAHATMFVRNVLPEFF